MGLSLVIGSIERIPGLSFNDITSVWDWHYGVVNNRELERYELYKFNLNGVKELIDSGAGSILNAPVSKQAGMLDYTVYNNKTGRQEQKRISVE